MATSAARRKTVKPTNTRTKKQDIPATDSNRDQMISVAAYYLAEKRNFNGGDPMQDWLEAEKTIDRTTDARASA